MSVWGTTASVAGVVRLERGAYAAGPTGQAGTFFYGIATVVLAVKLSGRFLKRDE